MAKRNIVWALVLVLAAAGFATAQETTGGSLAGQVTDAQGGAVPGATVTVEVAPGHQDVRDRRRRTILRPLPHAGPLRGRSRADRVQHRRAEEHPGAPRARTELGFS